MKRPWRRPARPYPLEHQILLTATLCLMAGGAVMVYSASSARTLLEGSGDGTTYLVKYLLYGVLGLVLMQVMARRGVELAQRIGSIQIVISFVLIVSVALVAAMPSGDAPFVAAVVLSAFGTVATFCQILTDTSAAGTARSRSRRTSR